MPTEDPESAARWSLRLGLARESVSPARDLQALAVAIPFGASTLGLGIARTGASSDLPDTHSLLQAEAYFKFPVWEQAGRQGFYISPDIQYLRHSNFDPAIDHAWVIGVRIGYEFCVAAEACL